MKNNKDITDLNIKLRKFKKLDYKQFTGIIKNSENRKLLDIKMKDILFLVKDNKEIYEKLEKYKFINEDIGLKRFF